MKGLALCLLLTIATFCAADDSDLTQSAYLDVQEKFYIEWQYTDTNITILAKVKTTGWFGIGFSPNGGMAGADIITAGVANGKPYLQDRYAERNGRPAVDASQDVELLSGSEVDGQTTIMFTRRHNTCDSKDFIIGTDTIRMIYAISPDGRDGLSYHTPFNRGTRSIFLRQAFADKPAMPADTVHFDVSVDKIDIPAYHTRYYCELKRVPKLDRKHHVIKVEPLIQKENLGLVHHILVYGCFDSIDRDHFFENNNTGHDCYNANMPNVLDRCRAPVAVWAIGGGASYYPEEAGYPMGDDKSPTYFLIEIHYDNPQLLAGKKDSSGLRFTMTKKLRQHDAGIIAAGGIFGISVPPKQKDFAFTGFCTSDCTKKRFTDEVKIFGAVLHGHLATRKVVARQFRDGKELRVIDADNHYDFNYQQYKKFNKPIDFKSGDDVMVTCHYNTEGRTGMTYGGLPSDWEMCITYLYHYPAQNLGDCYTMPSWVDPGYAKYFLNHNLKYNTTKRENVNTVFERMVAEGKWTEERVRQLEKGTLEFPQFDRCADRARNFAKFTKTYSAPAASSNPPPVKDYGKECAARAPKQPGSVVG